MEKPHRISWRPVAGILSLAMLIAAASAEAVVSFGRPAALSNHAALDSSVLGDDNEQTPSTAGDGAGNWVALWTGTAGPPLIDPSEPEIWVTRSSDDGLTWAPTTALVTNPGSGETDPSVATDRQGVWVAVWNTGQVLVSRSIDNGATWSAPVTPFGATGIHARIATNEAGVWVIVAELSGVAVRAVRSVDNAQTWGVPVEIDNVDPLNPAIATDKAGNWVTIWQRGTGTAATSRSIDNGASWQAPVVLGDIGSGGFLSPGSVAIATDRGLRWVAIWEYSMSTFDEMRYSFSIDNAATWAPQALFPPTANDQSLGFGVSTQTATDGTIYASWERTYLSDYNDAVFARSLDGGSTWTNVSAVNLRGRNDGKVYNTGCHLGYDGDDGWIATWMSTNDLDGTIGHDTDILFARAHDNCPASPMAGCKVPTESGAARIRIKDDADGPADKVIWIWRNGQETLGPDLGDPTTTSNYVLCIYDDLGSGPRPVFEADAGAALMCNGEPCWSGDATEYTYRDPARQNGAIKTLKVTAGEAGRAKVKVSAAGDALGPPRMPLSESPAVKVQLINLETTACWEASYSSADSNTSALYSGKSD